MKKNTNKEKGARLRDFRESKKISRQEFSRKIGLDNPDQLKSLELGRVKISGPISKCLLYEYGLNLDWLNTGHGQMSVEGWRQTHLNNDTTGPEPDAWYKLLLEKYGIEPGKGDDNIQMIIEWLIEDFQNNLPAQSKLMRDLEDHFPQYREFTTERAGEKKRGTGLSQDLDQAQNGS